MDGIWFFNGERAWAAYIHYTHDVHLQWWLGRTPDGWLVGWLGHDDDNDDGTGLDAEGGKGMDGYNMGLLDFNDNNMWVGLERWEGGCRAGPGRGLDGRRMVVVVVVDGWIPNLPRYWIERVSVPMNNNRPLFSHLLVLCCLLVKPSREEGWGSTSGHVVSLHLPPSPSLGARELQV